MLTNCCFSPGSLPTMGALSRFHLLHCIVILFFIIINQQNSKINFLHIRKTRHLNHSKALLLNQYANTLKRNTPISPSMVSRMAACPATARAASSAALWALGTKSLPRDHIPWEGATPEKSCGPNGLAGPPSPPNP